MTEGLKQRIDALADEVAAEAVQVRRYLHRHPELSWEERNSQAYIRAWLDERGLQARETADTGLYVDIGEGADPVIYRADLDALPIEDAKQPGRAVCVSEVPGVSHACGHDVHSSVAAGLCVVLNRLGSDLPGRVRVVFQPAEEVLPSGGNAILSEGILRGARAAIALHCDPTRDVGSVGLRVGPLTSTSDAFHIEVLGSAGHAARPHLARDAIAGAVQIVQALYSIVPQRVNPIEPAVLNVGFIEGGDAENVIADRVRLGGNLRTLNDGTRQRLHREIREVTSAAASIHGCSVEVSFKLGSPPVLNDPLLHDILERAAGDVLGRQGIQTVPDPSTGAEDFGQYTLETRVYMMRLGVHTPGAEIHHLHTPTFDPDEGAIPLAIRIMGRVMIDALGSNALVAPR